MKRFPNTNTPTGALSKIKYAYGGITLEKKVHPLFVVPLTRWRGPRWHFHDRQKGRILSVLRWFFRDLGRTLSPWISNLSACKPPIATLKIIHRGPIGHRHRKRRIRKIGTREQENEEWKRYSGQKMVKKWTKFWNGSFYGKIVVFEFMGKLLNPWPTENLWNGEKLGVITRRMKAWFWTGSMSSRT